MATKVQSTTASGAAVTSQQIALSGVTAGNTLILTVTYVDIAVGTSSAPATPIDSNGTVSTGIAPACQVNNGGSGAAVYYVPNCAAGTHTFTANPFNNANQLYCELTLAEWSGLTAAPLDKTSSSGSSSAASTTGGNTGTTATLTQANELVYAALSLYAGTGLANAGISTPATTGYTSLVAIQSTNTTVGTEVSYKEVAATTGQSAAWTWTSDSSMFTWQAAIATFLETGGGGGGTTQKTEDSPARNRPGRGPFSRGRFFISMPAEGLTSPAQAAALAATIEARNAASASLTTSITISASLASIASETAALSNGIALASTLAAKNAATAGLTTGIPVAAFLGGITTVSAQIGAGAPLAAQLFGSGALTAQLTSGIALASSLTSQAVIADALSTGIALSGSLFGQTLMMSALSTTITLASALKGAASISAALSSNIPLVANLAGVATFAAQFGAIAAALSAQFAGKAALTSQLSNGVAISAAFYGRAVAMPALSTGLALAAAMNGLTAISTALTTGIALTAAPGAIATIISGLTVAPGNALVATIWMRAAATAALSSQIQLGAGLAAEALVIGVLTDSFLEGSPGYVIRRIRARNWTVSSDTYLNFGPKYPDEEVKLTFDFTPDLPTGVTLIGPPVVAFAIRTGTDANPGALANGNAGLDVTAKEVIVPVQGGLDACDYAIHAWCATTDPLLSVSLTGILKVRS